MNITEITKRAGAHPGRKRVGRGHGSGSGKTCGRGHKGAGARAGYRAVSLAEGGMFPLFRRIPKFGFNNANFRTVYQIVNVADLEARFDEGAQVTAATLRESGLIRRVADPVKILGEGSLAKKLTVEAQRFSGEAAKKIEAAGGTVTRLGPQPKKKFVKRPKPRPEPEASSGKKSAGGAKGKAGGEKKKPKESKKPKKSGSGDSASKK